MPRFISIAGVAAVLTFVATGCATSPKTPEQRQSLRSESSATLDAMAAKDSSVRDLLRRAHGYAVFPNVGKGGAIVGGAYGRGVVFEQEQRIGYAELNQASVGAQLGGQTYAELIVFETADALGRLKAGNFSLGAEASAVVLKAGAAGEARFQNGIAVLILPKGGLMADVSVSGQKLNFEAAAEAESPGRTD
jgi:lipid-binding SYLF domain-containing protein